MLYKVATDKLRVVLVEDHDDSRLMMTELLEHAGFQCHTAETGALGLEIIDQLRPEAAMIDIGLPDMDGFEVARRLRQSRRHDELQLIALTGYGQREDHDESRCAGFDAHLVKPVDFERLFRLLRARGA